MTGVRLVALMLMLKDEDGEVDGTAHPTSMTHGFNLT